MCFYTLRFNFPLQYISSNYSPSNSLYTTLTHFSLFAPLYRHFMLASSAALNAHASGSLLKTLSCQKQVAATAQGEMAKNE